MYETEIRPRFDRLEMGEIAGVGQRIEDDKKVGGVLTQPVVHEIRADKACTAGHQ